MSDEVWYGIGLFLGIGNILMAFLRARKDRP